MRVRSSRRARPVEQRPLRARRWAGLGLALSLPVLLTLASGALGAATAVPGATYTGVATGYVDVTFTVSADGTLVNSYSIVGAVGHEPSGATCDFIAAGSPGYWPGGPVNGNHFTYALGQAISFQGRFTGPQTASGSFRLYDAANGSNPACDTGTVAWTASTPATPLGGPVTGGGTVGSGPTAGGGVKQAHVKTYVTWVSLKKKSAKWLSGSVKAFGNRCVNKRAVYLMLGRKRVAHVRTNARGGYLLAITRDLHGTRVRAVAPSRRTNGAICAAGSSKFLTT